MQIEPGTLYIVATPIGNLGDMTHRAIEVLSNVDKVCAEDTRNSRRLLTHFGIQQKLVAIHDHNERDKLGQLTEWLQAGESLALISDAGTPLISDPGYHLVQHLRNEGVKVVPIPGASAIIAALSIAGLATDRFVFDGFLTHWDVTMQTLSIQQWSAVHLAQVSRHLTHGLPRLTLVTHLCHQARHPLGRCVSPFTVDW